MEKITVYVAKDGTQFKDEKSCLNYEETLPKYHGFEFMEEVDFFDINEKIPPFCPVEERNIEDSNIMYSDEKGIEELSCIMRVGGLEANTICVYDYHEQWWYRLEDIIKIYEEKVKTLNELLLEIGKLIKI